MQQPEEMPQREELQRVDNILKQNIMTKAEYKKEFIEAWEKTLNEYRINTHSGTRSDCSLCKFDIYSDCVNCVNGLFAVDFYTGCNSRQNKFYSSSNYRNPKQNVIEFFELSLLWMQTIPEEHWHEIGTNPIFKGIKDIDEYVYHHHN